jgi:hypothetical protein
MKRPKWCEMLFLSRIEKPFVTARDAAAVAGVVEEFKRSNSTAGDSFLSLSLSPFSLQIDELCCYFSILNRRLSPQ